MALMFTYLSLVWVVIFLQHETSLGLKFSDSSICKSSSFSSSCCAGAVFDFTSHFCRRSFLLSISKQHDSFIVAKNNKGNSFNLKKLEYNSENYGQRKNPKMFVALKMQPEDRPQNEKIFDHNNRVGYVLERIRNIFYKLKIIIILYPLLLFIFPNLSHAAGKYLFYSPSHPVNKNPECCFKKLRHETSCNGKTKIGSSIPDLCFPNNVKDTPHEVPRFECPADICDTLHRNQDQGKCNDIYYDDYYYMNNEEFTISENTRRENSFNKKRRPFSDKSGIMGEDTITKSNHQYNLAGINEVKSLSGIRFDINPSSKRRLASKSIAVTFGPLVSICFIRETIRWHREQKNINRGFKHIKQQKDIHFGKEFNNSRTKD